MIGDAASDAEERKAHQWAARSFVFLDKLRLHAVTGMAVTAFFSDGV
jgi:hypothetical protein